MSPTRKKGTRPSVELVVRRGALRRFDKLKMATAELPVAVSWDRRTGERRTSAEGAQGERRQGDRRQKAPFTWETADFVVVEPTPRRRPASSR